MQPRTCYTPNIVQNMQQHTVLAISYGWVGARSHGGVFYCISCSYYLNVLIKQQVHRVSSSWRFHSCEQLSSYWQFSFSQQNSSSLKFLLSKFFLLADGGELGGRAYLLQTPVEKDERRVLAFPFGRATKCCSSNVIYGHSSGFQNSFQQRRSRRPWVRRAGDRMARWRQREGVIHCEADSKRSSSRFR